MEQSKYENSLRRTQLNLSPQESSEVLDPISRQSQTVLLFITVTNIDTRLLYDLVRILQISKI